MHFFKRKPVASQPGVWPELSADQLRQVQGGRQVIVMVDGRTPATVDDFSLNMEIFKGNIGGPMIL